MHFDNCNSFQHSFCLINELKLNFFLFTGHHGKSAALSLTMSSQPAGQQRVWKQSPPPQQLIRHIAISPSPSPTLHATNLSVSHQQVSHQGGAQQQQQQPPPSQSHSAQSLTTHQLLSGGPSQAHSQQQHLARSSPNVQPGVHPGSHGTSVSSSTSASSSAPVAVTSAHSVSQIQHQLQAVNAAHQREREREPAPNQSPAHQPSGHQVSFRLLHLFLFSPHPIFYELL